MKRVTPTQSPDNQALLIDLYELAMAQAYRMENMTGTAVFSLFFRSIPEDRNFMLACGQQDLVDAIHNLRFSEKDLATLRSLGMFREDFLDWLRQFRFSGRVMALPEGTPVFPDEPIVEVEAPIAEAQLLETLAMNTVHLETILASKAARLVLAAEGRPVVDFGMRRMHGLDAAFKGTRAFTVAGLAGTSDVLAGRAHGLPVKGTMAHSYIQAHDDEMAAFRTYACLYPNTTLLVDTYDTKQAVEGIIRMLKADPGLRVGAIRLDSGDLDAESRLCRQLLDEAGFTDLSILASSGLDEHSITRLIARKAPIDGFGVGTALGTSADAPSLDLAYKLTEYAGKSRLKNSPGKLTLPGRKQLYRFYNDNGQSTHDVIAERSERLVDDNACAEALLRPVMEQGNPVAAAMSSAKASAGYAHRAIARLPEAVCSVSTRTQFPVAVSNALKTLQQQTLARVTGSGETGR